MTTNGENDELRFSWKQWLLQWLNRPIRLICGFLLVLWPGNRWLLKLLSRTQPERRPDNVTFVDWRPPVVKEADEALHRRRVIGRRVAAAVVGGVLICSFVALRVDVVTPSGVFASATPESPVVTGINDAAKTHRLEDGSVVTHDARCRLQFDFADGRRDVHVVVGKARFKVSKDTAANPFRAATLLMYASAAADTDFSVEVGTSVFVHVYYGVVKLSRRGAMAGTALTTVEAGESVEVRADGIVAVLAGDTGSSVAELVDTLSFPTSHRSSTPPIVCRTEPRDRRRRVA